MTKLNEKQINDLMIYLHQKYPDREHREFKRNDDSLIGEVNISKDYDNSVVIFQPTNQKETADSTNIFEHSITAISYNPAGIKIPNWKPSNKHKYNDKLDPENDNEEETPLETTRSMILKRFLENDQLEKVKNQSFNRLIQCDLCIEPSPRAVDTKITSDNVNSYETILKAMEASKYIFLSWGNGAYSKPGELMTALKNAGFPVNKFYEYLVKRAENDEVYSFRLTKYSHQPVQPVDYTKRELHCINKNDLNQIFDGFID